MSVDKGYRTSTGRSEFLVSAERDKTKDPESWTRL